MQELMLYSVNTHVIALFVMVLTSTIILFIFYSREDYVRLTKSYERGSLTYFMFLGMFVFTGFLAWAVLEFVMSVKVVMMVLAVLHMIVTSFKLNRVFKRSRVRDIQSQKEFVKYAKKKYTVDIFILIVIGVVAYAIHF